MMTPDILFSFWGLKKLSVAYHKKTEFCIQLSHMMELPCETKHAQTTGINSKTRALLIYQARFQGNQGHFLRINTPTATSREIIPVKPMTNSLLTIKRDNNCDHYSKIPFCSHANHCSNANSGIIPNYMDLATERPLLPETDSHYCE